MKNTWKKLSAILIAAVLAVMSVSVVAQAGTVRNSERSVILYSSTSRNYNSFWGKYTIANITNIDVETSDTKITGLKSSNPNVATVAIKNGSKNTMAEGYKAVYVKAKSVGTTTISYKAGNDTYKIKLTVKPYVNALKTLKVAGKNIRSSFKTDNVRYMSYKQYANKTIKLSYKEADGWSVFVDYLEKVGNMKSDWVKNNSTFKVTGKNSALIITATNMATGDIETYMVIFK